LHRFRPRLWLPAGHEGPIRFYDDYIAHGRLIDGRGAVVSAAVDRATLNRHKADPQAVFEHRPSGGAPRPVVYGRIDHGTYRFPDGNAARFVFLTYHAVFRHSGLPAGLDGWRAAALDVVASLADWHQLDHYTALTIALDGDRRPVAATFQHHNYLRTHVLGVDLALPADGRLEVDVAIRSNELYPRRAGRTVRRAVAFLDAATARYLLFGGERPWRAADDLTDGVREIDYALEFLPPSDAFYTFQGFLGERRLLPGRSGPPGADYNTLPVYKDKAVQMIAFHWRDNDRAYLEALARLDGGGLDALAARFAREWACGSAATRLACAE
jgi:hypothetical protein